MIQWINENWRSYCYRHILGIIIILNIIIVIFLELLPLIIIFSEIYFYDNI